MKGCEQTVSDGLGGPGATTLSLFAPALCSVDLANQQRDNPWSCSDPFLCADTQLGLLQERCLLNPLSLRTPVL